MTLTEREADYANRLTSWNLYVRLTATYASHIAAALTLSQFLSPLSHCP